MKRLRLALATLLCTPVLLVGTTQAWNPFGATCQNGSAQTSAVCQDSNTKGDPVNNLIMNVINFIALLAGAAAVIMIVIGGWQLIQSGGSSDKVAAARRTILYSIVGLVVIALSRQILAFVLGSLQ